MIDLKCLALVKSCTFCKTELPNNFGTLTSYVKLNTKWIFLDYVKFSVLKTHYLLQS